MLTWEDVGELPEPRIRPAAVPSVCGRFVYLIGGNVDLECRHTRLIKFDTLTSTSECLVDGYPMNPPAPLTNRHHIFHLSEELGLFLWWGVEDGVGVIRLVSYLKSGFDLEIKVKEWGGEPMAREAVALRGNNLHILMPQGKYCVITIHKLQNVSVKWETLYAS
jgi:hypothetical protein